MIGRAVGSQTEILKRHDRRRAYALFLLASSVAALTLSSACGTFVRVVSSACTTAVSRYTDSYEATALHTTQAYRLAATAMRAIASEFEGFASGARLLGSPHTASNLEHSATELVSLSADFDSYASEWEELPEFPRDSKVDFNSLATGSTRAGFPAVGIDQDVRVDGEHQGPSPP